MNKVLKYKMQMICKLKYGVIMKLIKIFLAILFLNICLTSCGINNNSDIMPQKDIIAVSIVPQAAFVNAICQNDFEVITMIPPSSSPETYEPGTADMQKLSKAKIYFAIGVPSEQAILKTLSSSTKVINLHEICAETYPELEINGGRDPHIWMSPKRAMIMLSAISDEIIKNYKGKEEFYRKNYEDYNNKLKLLDNKIHSLLDTKQNRKFIVLHPAFAYFADEYSLTMFALEEHGKEANAKKIQQMADFAKKEKIKTVFYQAETSMRQATAFAEEIGGKAVALNPLAYDYIENLETVAKEISEAIE